MVERGEGLQGGKGKVRIAKNQTKTTNKGLHHYLHRTKDEITGGEHDCK